MTQPRGEGMPRMFQKQQGKLESSGKLNNRKNVEDSPQIPSFSEISPFEDKKLPSRCSGDTLEATTGSPSHLHRQLESHYFHPSRSAAVAWYGTSAVASEFVFCLRCRYHPFLSNNFSFKILYKLFCQNIPHSE